jgi:hypothetical protein
MSSGDHRPVESKSWSLKKVSASKELMWCSSVKSVSFNCRDECLGEARTCHVPCRPISVGSNRDLLMAVITVGEYEREEGEKKEFELEGPHLCSECGEHEAFVDG